MVISLLASGLLFYLSGTHGTTADRAAGNAEPNFERDIELVDDGALGQGLHCRDGQLLSWRAAENIHARRGTLSFWWRASSPWTETEFPIFRVGYADHSSWDMTFLRIDYNGHGFDAFVTDANLARSRVSVRLDQLPAPEQWTHFALAWDENAGIRLYLDGRLAGRHDTTMVLDAALDQFGPHSRIISPYQVQSAYQFQRGGDIDELRIYDHAIAPDEVAALARKQVPEVEAYAGDLSDPARRDEWLLRYGWTDALPPVLEAEQTTIRKVQILEPYDLKRWWWKANDGIRETTWPGVYNRSRIVGRNDYFQLPDWDCYSTSGRQIRFVMPDEAWNHIEFSGGADGRIETPSAQFERARGLERSVHRTPQVQKGGQIVFTNRVQETPIGEFDTYYIHAGDAPQGIMRREYRVAPADRSDTTLAATLAFIRGRHPADERGGKIAHILIPPALWSGVGGGLDGIRVSLPALDVAPLRGGLFPMNLRVMDPIWPLRRMADFSFSVEPRQARVLWIDLRDRILPSDRPLYIALTGAPGFDEAMVAGMRVELVFKPFDEAKAEHIVDRFTQVRDNYAMIVEEHPRSPRLDKYNQFRGDLDDLLRVDPTHRHAREYDYIYHPTLPRPEVAIAPAPAGVPEWAHLQLEYLGRYRYWVEWVFDNRQIENGELGGGLSDDSDFGNWLPPLALMGIMPDRIDRSVAAMMEAIEANGMLDRGMSVIQSDGLHTFEEGVNVIGQLALLRRDDPAALARLREAAQSVADHLVGVNAAGHTHFRSDYFSRTEIADRGIWAWASERQALHLIPAIYLGQLHGDEASRKLVIAMADGLLAHATTTPDGAVKIDVQIHFQTDSVRPSGMGNYAPVFWSAWRWTGDEKYLAPLRGRMHDVATNTTPLPGKPAIEARYRELIAEAAVREYSNTLGYLWTDRMVLDIVDIQRHRLGGVAQTRAMFFPGNAVSWRFADERDAEKVAILFPERSLSALQIELFNSSAAPVEVTMTGWDVDEGTWALRQSSPAGSERRSVDFGPRKQVTLTLPPMQTTRVEMARE